MIQVKPAKPDCFILSGPYNAPAIGLDNCVSLKDRHKVKLDSEVFLLSCFHQVVRPQTSQFTFLHLSFLDFQNATLCFCSTPKSGLGPTSISIPLGVLEMQNLSSPPHQTTKSKLAFSMPQKCEQH